MPRRLIPWLAGLLLGLLLLGPAPSHATIKALVTVRGMQLVGPDLVFDLAVVTVGQATFTTQRTVARTAITDPATVLASIKGLVITFALNQHGVTIVDTEILVIGAPQ